MYWDVPSFQSSLAPCSLTCRHWATQIRPVLFAKVVIKSHDAARSFTSFARCPAAVPGPLRLVVREIQLLVNNAFRPWMYHVWALFRDVALPNLQRVDLTIEGNESEAGWRKSDEPLLDIGLPRTLPSAHHIPLHLLTLLNLRFRSHATLLRCSTYHRTERILCTRVKWPEGSPVSAPAGHLLSRLTSHIPDEVFLDECTSIASFVWRVVTTQPSTPGAAPRLLYISATQINAVMGILRLFSDECECRECEGRPTKWDYKLRVYTGAHRLTSYHMCSASLDPTDGAMRCLSLGCDIWHTLAVQIEPSGTVSRVCLMMDDASRFLPLGDNLPSDQSTAVLDSMLARLDQLCESLGDALREVVIAHFPFTENNAISEAELLERMHVLRDQMPGMARRQRLVFRASRKTARDFSGESIWFDAVVERVFECDGQYWKDIDLGDQ